MTQIQQLKQQHSLASWKQIILAQQNSGLTAAEYCRQQNIKYNAFYYWQRKIREDFAAAALQITQRMSLLLNLLRWQPLPLRLQFRSRLILWGDLECSCRKIFADFALPIVKGIVLDILLAAIFCGSKPAVLLGKDDLFPGC